MEFVVSSCRSTEPRNEDTIMEEICLKEDEVSDLETDLSDLETDLAIERQKLEDLHNELYETLLFHAIEDGNITCVDHEDMDYEHITIEEPFEYRSPVADRPRQKGCCCKCEQNET